MATFGNGRRVAIVAGVRTPFAKAGTAFKSISAIELGKLCVAELLQRTNLDGKEVQALVFGTVIPSVVAPNIAREVAQGMPAATVIACADGTRAAAARGRISGPRLRAYTNEDVIGVEVGGAIKNVIAIGTGICDGLEAGDNAKAAIITRGLAEMTRLGVAMGARAQTFSGLTGLGDLVVTCSSPHSRNRQLGIGIGTGKTLEELESNMTMVAEGVNTTREALRLGKQLGVELPITEAVAEILFEKADPMHVAIRLMQRTGRSESEGLGLS